MWSLCATAVGPAQRIHGATTTPDVFFMAKVLRINDLHFSADYDLASTVAALRRCFELNPAASTESMWHRLHVSLRKELDASEKIEAP